MVSRMKTDVEIAREASLKPISEVGNELGLFESELEYYGPYKAKSRMPPLSACVTERTES